MRTIVLQYHDVVESDDFGTSGFIGADADTYKMSRSTFEEHVSAISATVAPALPELAGGRLPSVLFTFDDGGVSAVTVTADVLERRGWRGIFLVTTDWIGRPGFLTEAQLRELDVRGHVVGAHSCSHPLRFARCAPAVMRAEWEGSVGRLADVLGHPVTVASVPGGYYSRQAAVAADQAGIGILFTSEPVAHVARVGGCRVVGRYTLRRWSPAATAARIAAGALAPRTSQWLVWNGKKMVKAIAGTGYLRVRQAILGRS